MATIQDQVNLYFALWDTTGVGSRYSLHATVDGKQARVNAAAGSILATAVLEDPKGFVLSDLGNAVIKDARYKDRVAKDVRALIAKGKKANRDDQKAALDAFNRSIGLSKLKKAVPCDGCGRNKTCNQDRFGKHYCARSKDCRALRDKYYARLRAKGKFDEAPADDDESSDDEMIIDAARAALNSLDNDDDLSSDEEEIVAKKTKVVRKKRSP